MNRYDFPGQAAAARAYDNAYDDAAEALDEARDEFIADEAPAIASDLLGAEDFAWRVLVDLNDEGKNSILQDVGRFFDRFHNAPDDNAILASIGVSLWRALRPTIEAAALEEAEQEAGTRFDMMDHGPQTAAEARAELEGYA